MQQQQKTNR